MPVSRSKRGCRRAALLDRAHEVERAFGRDRHSETRWGPRTLDIDILAYDDMVLDEPMLTLPHPRLFERAFVLVPLVEIAPDAAIGGRSLAEALDRLDRSGIERLPLTLSRPRKRGSWHAQRDFRRMPKYRPDGIAGLRGR